MQVLKQYSEVTSYLTVMASSYVVARKETKPAPTCYSIMTTPANDHDKPSPSDSPTHRPKDNGHKSVVKKEDKQYHGDEPQQENVAKRYEKEEQPVTPVKNPPKENQPDASDDNARRLESK